MFYTEKVKVVVNEDGQSEGMEEKVMVNESDVEETCFWKGIKWKDETNTGNFNTKKIC